MHENVGTVSWPQGVFMKYDDLNLSWNFEMFDVTVEVAQHKPFC